MEFRRISRDIEFTHSMSEVTAKKIQRDAGYTCIRSGACYEFYKNGKLVENNQSMHNLCYCEGNYYGTLGAIVFEIRLSKIEQQCSKYTVIRNPNGSLMIGTAQK